MAALLDDVLTAHPAIGRSPVDRRIGAYLASVMASGERDACVEDVLRGLLAERLDRLPLPGHGATLERWRALERVGRHDLALVKLYEGHTDALAILAEIDPLHTVARGALYAVWASEARSDPITIAAGADVRPDACVTITGRKSWCSGAAVVDAALMTAVASDGARHLVEIDLASPGIRLDRDRWHAVGMGHSGSFDVVCTGAPARVVGRAGAYLARPGFWHGGAGIAACWFGAAAAIGTRVRALQRDRDDVHALAHLGAIDGALAGCAALLRECAAAIDATPDADATRIVLRVRTAVADACERVVADAMRAIGPGPLCNEGDLARRVADLPIFVRQSRAEHDLVAQSRALLANAHEATAPGWLL